MNDIRWFRFSIVAIGLFFTIWAGANALYYLIVFAYYKLNSSVNTYGYPDSSYALSAIPGAIQFILGLVLIVKSPSISRYFASRTVGRCPGCNYSISGLPEGAKCPECGEPTEHTRQPLAQTTQPKSNAD